MDNHNTPRSIGVCAIVGRMTLDRIDRVRARRRRHSPSTAHFVAWPLLLIAYSALLLLATSVANCQATPPLISRSRRKHSIPTTHCTSTCHNNTAPAPRGGASPVLAPLLLQTPHMSHYVRVGLAGGIAGAVGTAILYPIDTAKSLFQSNPTRYASVRHALMDLIFSSSTTTTTKATTIHAPHHSTLPRAIRIQKAYRGVLPATLGAIPSSALYFGAYETCKTLITTKLRHRNHPHTTATSRTATTSLSSRLAIHSLAAASGNILSSAVFVPKEFWKQQLQCYGDQHTTLWGVVRDTLNQHGWRGMYAGYQATLLRNVPSAILRFGLYEELKYRHIVWSSGGGGTGHPSGSSSSSSTKTTTTRNTAVRLSPALFVAGALSGAAASGFMTPLDVYKTRLATHTIPTAGFVASARHILEQDGLRGLYAGAGSRMVWSGAFSAIGFSTFELAKSLLGVGGDAVVMEEETNDRNERVKSKKR